MKTIKTNKFVKADLLQDEMRVVVPTANIRTWSAGWADHTENDIEVDAPDGTADATVLNIIAAHNPAAQSDAEKITARKAQAPTDFKASTLATMTYAQAAAWIDSNVTDLASARTALKQLARMVLALRDRGDVLDT